MNLLQRCHQQVDFSHADYADSSVQVPSPGKHFTFYTLGEDHPATNEKWFSVYFVTSQRFQEVGS